jgi:hypothetical protein
MANQTSLAKQNYSGLDLEKKSPLRLRAKFFLDIPFNRTSLLIELIDAKNGEVKAQACANA